MKGKAGQKDARKGSTLEETHFVITDPPARKDSLLLSATDPQPDYMKWSTASLFVCLCWGILAIISSNKVRKCNSIRDYKQAAFHSQNALRHNKSAIACCVVMILIIGVPLAISLAVQGSITKFPTVREFFG